MAGFDALAVRDLVALTVIAARTIAQYHAANAEALVGEAFEVADAFIAASEGRWADGARANHKASGDRRQTSEDRQQK